MTAIDSSPMTTPSRSNSNSSSSSSNVNSDGTARGRAFVKMFEIVDASKWTHDKDGAINDLRPLLLLMDIGSCASAEKHTGVNCVTASMGDVVIEHYPRIGELLELRASPVDTGNTSLNIAVSVFAHGVEFRWGGDSDDDEENDEENDEDEEEENKARTLRVCEAFFTYVTTRGPSGEKRFVPPLENTAESTDGSKDFSNDTTWERTLARFRKQLIRSEQSATKPARGYTIPRSRAVFECSEVVLPSHQNHMGHLFGGVVMGWMCKSVQAACVKATGLPLKRFRIRAIHRVDFPRGADVSDHVFLRPRITAIFDDGRSAEVEVMVAKRRVTADASDTARNNGEETTMNFGYFYVSGLRPNESSSSSFKPTGKSSSRVAPFARLLKSRMELSAEFEAPSELITRACQRRKSMLARRHLLAGIGEPIPLDASLEVQAPLLTILSVLRLCDEYEKSHCALSPSSGAGGEGGAGSSWETIDTGGDGDESNRPRVEWTKGDRNTVWLHGHTVISRRLPPTIDGSCSNEPSFLQDVFQTLCGDRSEWDPFTMSARVLEQQKNKNNDDDSVGWDVVEYEMKASETAQYRFCLLRAFSYIGEDGSPLPRKSPADGDESSNSNHTINVPASAVLASRTVCHEQSSAQIRVLPSGFLLKTLGGTGGKNESESEFLEISYVSEVRNT